MGAWGLLFTSFAAQAMIYGSDTRVAVSSSADLRAQSTAIAVLSSLHEPAGPNKFKLTVDSLKGEIFPEEKFANDVSLAYSCTGFLVAPDLIVTAGHCMVNTGQDRNQTDTYCQAYSWLFDYDDALDINSIPNDKLYACKKIIYAVRDEKAPFRDFALVRLDRAVKDRKPLKLAPRGGLAVGDALSMVGFPLGTPAKLSSGARILLNDMNHQDFIANLDAFEGNSGSPVFNSANEVVGILVGATPHVSLIEDAKRSCQRYNRCDGNGDNCEVPETQSFPEFQRIGAMVQRMDLVLDLINNSGAQF